MKKYIIFIITIMYFSIYAQEMHYYFNNKKINLTKNLRTINVLTNSNYFLTLEDSLYEITTLYVDPEISKKYLKIYVKSNNPEYYNSLINILSNNNNIQNISYYFEREGTSPIGTSENFYLKVKDDNKSYQKLVDYSNIYGYTIVNPLPYMEKWYLIKLNPKNYDNVINVTSKLYETGDFDEIDPAFMFNFNSNCVNDPNFNQIWGLNNSNGNNIGICNAWNLSLGTNVKVAVVDQGIEKTHEDLSPNMSPLSFNTITGNSPSGNVNSHGTFIAGIIGGARNNGKGIAGVAPNCKIMSVSHLLNNSTTRPTLSAELASGINWARLNDAEVINCSWGDWNGLYQNLHSAAMEQAISNAITYGRNQKGCIVVFGTGNLNLSYIDYPANTNPDILVVGSINSNGNRSGFSNYGNKLDVIAPGESILSTNLGNSYSYKDGTSFSAPFVSGLAALVISMNPNLTGRQIRDAIERNCKKLNNYSFGGNVERQNGSWNNEVGYGLIDAHQTLLDVQREQTYINQLNICIPLNVNSITSTTTQNYTKCVINSKNTKIQGGTTTFNATLESNLFENFEVTGGNFEIKGQ